MKNIFIYERPKTNEYSGILLDLCAVRRNVENLPKHVGTVYTNDPWVTSVYRARGKRVLSLPQKNNSFDVLKKENPIQATLTQASINAPSKQETEEVIKKLSPKKRGRKAKNGDQAKESL